jgi:hypothetical protein
MAYSDFTLPEVKRKFGLAIDEDSELFPEIPETVVSRWLQETLRETFSLALAIHTEKARSELLIAPILVELRKLTNQQVSFFSGVEFSVDPAVGLNGVCDYLISQSPEQLFITAPVLIIVEAKNENIKGGFAQCIATMIAAQRFNQREQNPINAVYGAVTTGTNWRFLRLEANYVQIGRREYHINQVEQVLGVLFSITSHPQRAMLQPI